MNNGSAGARWLLLAGLCATAATAAAESLSGELRWAAPRPLTFAVSGVVQDVAGRPGMRIAGGGVLARLDPRPFTGRADQAQALRDAAAPALARARRDLDTATDLHERTVLSDYELRDAELALQEADARHRRSQAELALAELDLERSELRAPMDAIVLEVAVQPGMLVVSSLQAQAHVTVAMAAAMDVYVPVAPATFERVRLGDKAEVALRSRTYRAEVVALGLPSAERPGASLILRFAHPPAERYYPGTAVGVELP